ncbi:hypothetical protein C2G38_2073280 [Gigaspora rosea]|uniref:Uncharacterized protein n=1 Tax=Gigaspora rosea TaxID=44941 RepID=A0A397VN18_9GLOM|nr:hypothetical protein C2G38_2073280 [Gigaspora rosea]
MQAPSPHHLVCTVHYLLCSLLTYSITNALICIISLIVDTNDTSVWIYYYDIHDNKHYGIDYNGQLVDISYESYMLQVS